MQSHWFYTYPAQLLNVTLKTFLWCNHPMLNICLCWVQWQSFMSLLNFTKVEAMMLVVSNEWLPHDNMFFPNLILRNTSITFFISFKFYDYGNFFNNIQSQALLDRENSEMISYDLYIIPFPWGWEGLPCGSAGKESTCNVGNLSSIPGLGRSPGEG